jgi:hypothetical protein
MPIIRFAPSVLILAGFACGGKSLPLGTLPSDPVGAVEQFLAGVKANDLSHMGDVWGSDKGPANAWMPNEQRHQRLTVMQSLLVFESFRVDPSGIRVGNSQDERVIRVQLSRNGCKPIVPFTVRKYGDGWLVSDIDLAAAGNPHRACGG